ncbi:VOC family protein [Alkalihalophilus lindianensis]|uniref:VOC family protein n=1 Tax=Alkalihalophilus lindianensis TaxID=1630542 RepID=A0ABU3X4I3_9BACI|nr:VOC family protein [Alkalihalophilus lindianensis]MDV2682791.1 VOC family protein [Alkalihalophilus lindianensis]
MKITEVSLSTSNLNEMRSFYEDVLELPMVKEDKEAFTVQVGATTLTFLQSNELEDPFYHFAINIPENKMDEAKAWIQSKVELNTENDSDEVFFKSWNARAIYFEDPAGNILEFIARHNLKNGVTHRFSSMDFLNVSEVGVVVRDVIPFVRKLNQLGLPNWREDSEGLTPVGDETGLFITVKNGRRWFFSTKDAKFFPFEVSIEGTGRMLFEEQGDKISILSCYSEKV